jgi:hypothetical protein
VISAGAWRRRGCRLALPSRVAHNGHSGGRTAVTPHSHKPQSPRRARMLGTFPVARLSPRAAALLSRVLMPSSLLPRRDLEVRLLPCLSAILTDTLQTLGPVKVIRSYANRTIFRSMNFSLLFHCVNASATLGKVQRGCRVFYQWLVRACALDTRRWVRNTLQLVLEAVSSPPPMWGLAVATSCPSSTTFLLRQPR